MRPLLDPLSGGRRPEHQGPFDLAGRAAPPPSRPRAQAGARTRALAGAQPRAEAAYRFVPALMLILALAALAVAQSRAGITPPLTLADTLGLIERRSALGIAALGLALVVMLRSVDLSVAATAVLAAALMEVVLALPPTVFVDGMWARLGVAPTAAAPLLGALVVVLLGLVVGLVNALAITALGVPPLIATLAMALVLTLAAAWIGPPTLTLGPRPTAIPGPVTGLALPAAPLVLGALVLAGTAILAASRFGLHVAAVGRDPAAARAAGLRVERVVVTTHVACSLLACLAGLLAASVGAAGLVGPVPGTIGLEAVVSLEVLAVVALGGSALAGARSGVLLGTLIALVAVAILEAAWLRLGAPPALWSAAVAVMLVGALMLYPADRPLPEHSAAAGWGRR